MNRTVTCAAWICLAGIAVTGCRARETNAARAEDPESRTPQPGAVSSGSATAVTVSPELQARWGITVGAPGRSAVAETLTLPGTIGVNERRTVRISPPVEAHVLSVEVTSGSDVRRNQTLVTLRAPAIAQARMTYVQASVALDLARRDFERGRTLLEQEAIDQRDLFRRKTEYDHAVAQFGVAESALHSLGLEQTQVERLLSSARDRQSVDVDDLADPALPIVSPLGGRVIAHDAIVGQHVSPASVLFVVSDLSTVWATLDAPESDLPRLSAGQGVRITTSVFPDAHWPGRVLHVGDVIDPQSRTVKVRVAVRNDDRILRPNMYIRGDITGTQTVSDVTTVPEAAVQIINGTTIVFVQEAPTRFVAVPIERGRRLADGRVVVTGLSGVETLALTGTFTLKAEYLKSTLGGE